MNIVFSGGSAFQRQLVTQAVAAMKGRHFDLDQFEHDWNVNFKPPGEVDTTPHDAFRTFMVTQNDGSTDIRSDMPFGGHGPFSGTQFFQESVVHELGHHLLGNGPGLGQLSPEDQEAIAALFDSTPDGWNPQGKPWEDRPVEGIAETFKDSFLAGSRRVYFNRTREKLPIKDYPEFRRLWREGAVRFASQENVTDVFASLKDGPDPTGTSDVYVESGVLFNGTMGQSHNLHYAFTPPPGNWPSGWFDYLIPADDNNSLHQGGALQWEFAVIVNGITVIAHGGAWELFVGPSSPGPFAGPGWAIPEVGAYEGTFPLPGPYHEEAAPGGHIWRMAGSLTYDYGQPPFTIVDSFQVRSGDDVVIKAGVNVVGPTNADLGTDPGSPEYPFGSISVPPYLPTMPIAEHAKIEVPQSALTPGPLDSGVIHHGRPIVG